MIHHIPLILLSLLVFATSSCQSTAPLHNGRIPICLMETPPKHTTNAFARVAEYVPGSTGVIEQIQPGDLIAFHMSHAEAGAYLRRGIIQKLPYELARFGHLALVVPGDAGEHWKLLQLAMGDAANDKEGRSYLVNRTWQLFRTSSGKPNLSKLSVFAKHITGQAEVPAARYDFKAVFGIYNHGLMPADSATIAKTYSCTTMVVAAYYYADYPLAAVHRKGVMDMVTPRQVVESGPLLKR
jgi:hypothetical protein